MDLPGHSGPHRFGDFVLDVAAYELRRGGRRVRVERQPMDLLILLVRQRGQLVSRSQIVEALWPKDVFVDVENGVNTAMRKLRQALRDAPDAPRFIETVPGKGYRFIAAVETLPQPPGVASPVPPAAAASPDVAGTDASVAARASTRACWQPLRWSHWRERSSGFGGGRSARADASRSPYSRSTI
jgi:DNA-binding winged helix-turn-helix (wHTH) protein